MLSSSQPLTDQIPTQVSAPSTTQFALRYGMNDLLCVTGLFGLHMGLGMLLIPAKTMTGERDAKVILCAILAATFAFAAAYLAYRLSTKRKVEDFGTRLTWLILLDLMLIAVFPAGIVLYEIVIATSPWLPLLSLTFYMGYVTGKANTPQPKDIPPVRRRVVEMENSESMADSIVAAETSRI